MVGVVAIVESVNPADARANTNPVRLVPSQYGKNDHR
jgi:hypothetical protein